MASSVPAKLYRTTHGISHSVVFSSFFILKFIISFVGKTSDIHFFLFSDHITFHSRFLDSDFVVDGGASASLLGKDTFLQVETVQVAHEDYRAEVKMLARHYGTPRRVDFTVEMMPEEFQLVQRFAERGRHHDVTLFICHQGKYVVVEKHAYAKSGIFRAPSGGAQPSESLVDAAKREAWEETGLKIELERFILESHVLLVCENFSPINWVSYVFLARAVGGELGAKDTREISDVQLRTREEMIESIRPLMLASGSGGFRYRALLTDAFFEAFDELDTQS